MTVCQHLYSTRNSRLSLWFLQDLPDVQELIADVNAEKYSLQAAAILGEGTFLTNSFLTCSCIFYHIRTHLVPFFSFSPGSVYKPQEMFVFQTRMRLLKLLLSSR